MCCTANKWFIRLSGGRFMALAWWKRRFISLMSVGLPCLGVALAVPGNSGTVLSVTGATGECGLARTLCMGCFPSGICAACQT